jgi:ribose transport system substrate-binding protein
MDRAGKARWLPIFALVSAALLVMGACNGDDEPAEPEAEGAEPIRAAVFLASAANTYWQAALEGVQEAADEAGNVEITQFDADFDTATQQSQLRDALVGEPFDVWFIGPNDGSALVAEIEEAVAAGVKVGCTLVPCGPDIQATEVQIEGVVAEASVPFFDNGRHLGELTVEACEGHDPCRVIWVPGLPELPLELARTEGLMSVLDEHENIEVIDTLGGGYLAEPALEVVQDTLVAQPDTNVIVSSGDQMIVGAERAVEAAGPEGDIALIGNGATTDGVQAIMEGRWFASAAYIPRTEAKLVAERLFAAARGEEIEGEWIDPLEIIGVDPLITQENADQFEPEFEG